MLKLLRIFLACVVICPSYLWAEDVNESAIAVRTERVFDDLDLRRPVFMTHAGDGSQRIFVVTQQGVISSFKKGKDGKSVQDLKTFLDIEDKVVYADNKNEEGLLGLAFHPKFKDNGYFYVYYTTKAAPQTSVISRFTADKSGVADPASELEIMQIGQPFWNHNGGTILFGPDGYLYVGLGDGGLFNDPEGNGQNVQTLLGSILRIDVDQKQNGMNYGIPSDNPFVGQERYARPEVYAWGFRNIWRMSFDRQDGTLWAADVGQDIWEEINIVHKGKNYGWDLREAKHKFGPVGADAREDLVDPIWEYHHDVGKSITGGYVYRGKSVPALQGYYLYGDYVSGQFWALKYDASAGKVTENRSITSENIPVMTYGEDESGEVYFSDPSGRIFRFVAE